MYIIKVFIVNLMSTLFILIGVASHGERHKSCRCVASDACWPTAEEWDAFNRTIGGRLIAPKPTGYSCHSPHFNATRCEIIRADSFNAYMRADNAGSMQMDHWEDKGKHRCALKAPKSVPCHQGRVSVLGVRIESVADVQEAVRFAARHHLRVAVKSSGHDYMGRSTAARSFLIWMHKMRRINIDYSFSIATTVGGGNCRQHRYVQPAITVVGGVFWREVYDKLRGTGYIVLGGMALTVCATGGYVQGGGHGAMGPLFGLAVDNVLQIEVVTANGSLRTVNACNDRELFFALRGGGGGTFGVVTSVTYKLHKNPSNLINVYFRSLPPDGATWSTATREDILTVWSQSVATLDAAHWGGYWMFGDLGFIGYFLVPATEAAANDAIAPVMQALSRIDNVTVMIRVAKTRSFQDWHGMVYVNTRTGTDNTEVRALVGSRIVPYSALKEPRSLAQTIVAAMAKSGTQGVEGIMVLGPGVRNADPHGATAVTPTWRRGIWHMLSTSTWAWNATEAEKGTARMREKVFVEELHKAYPDSGAYLNEANIDEPRWKQSFWGKKNYARLLTTKLRVDPFGLFVCRKCVGSDLRQNNVTCRLEEH